MAHEHDVRDADKRFSIDPITRKITNQQKDKVSFVQGDHNSERITFEIPRYVDGHDMSLATKAQVHYLNVDSPGRYDADDLALDGEETVTFTWLVKKPATGKVGQLAFMVKFRCYEGDEIVYEWNTATFTGINIVSGMDNGEEIAKIYADVLAAWEKRIKALEEGDIDVDLSAYLTKDEAEQTYLTEHQSLEGYAKVEDIPTDYLTEVPSEYVTEAELEGKGYLTEVPPSVTSWNDLEDKPFYENIELVVQFNTERYNVKSFKIDLEINVGDVCKVVIGDKEYVGSIKRDKDHGETLDYFGNPNAYSSKFPSENFPFCLEVNSTSISFWVGSSGVRNEDVEIYKIDTKSLDEKFLPESVALKSDLPTDYLTKDEADQTYQPLGTDADVLETVTAVGLVEPVATSAGEILTDSDGKIYSL